MENLNVTLLVCLAIPLSMLLLLFKGRSRLLCAFLLTGMVVCVLSGEVNGLFLNLLSLEPNVAAVNVAPMAEEFFKAIPIIFIAFLLKPSTQRLSELALAIGVGFATLENISILITSGDITFIYAFLRAIGAGVMHGICTLSVGIAMRKVVERKVVFFSGTIAAYSVAVIYHSIYNMLISSRFMVLGAVLPIVTFAVMLVFNYAQNKNLLKGIRERENETVTS